MGIKISDLNPVAAALISDEIPINRAGASFKLTVDQIRSLIVAALVDSAPETLDTLNELAAALGDDPNFAATTAAAIAQRLELSGGTMTGPINFGSFPSTNAVLTSPALNAPTITSPTGYLLSNSISGLTVSNSAGDAVNDIQVAAGSAASDASPPTLVRLSSAIVKRTDAAWAAGTDAGGWLDGSSMPNGIGHVYVIYGTSGVDVGVSASLSPTLPAGYNTGKRRVGIIIRSAGAILPFLQVNRRVILDEPITLRSSASLFSEANFTVLAGAGRIRPIIRFDLNPNASSNIVNGLGDGDGSAKTVQQAANSNPSVITVDGMHATNSGGQLKFVTTAISGTVNGNTWFLRGWYDDVQ